MILLTVVILLLQKTVIGPLIALTENVRGVGDNRSPESLPQIVLDDEIGLLSSEFNAMFGRLIEVRRRLIEESYRADKMDIAAAVPHNIRNSIYPVVVSVEACRYTFGKISLDKNQWAHNKLEKGGLSDEERVNLNEYLRLSYQRFGLIIPELQNKLLFIFCHIRRIEELLHAQDIFTRNEVGIEKFFWCDLLQDSITLVPDNLLEDVEL